MSAGSKLFSLPQALDTNFFYAQREALLSWWDICLNVNGDKMEV
jgi:hypothetical protein